MSDRSRGGVPDAGQEAQAALEAKRMSEEAAEVNLRIDQAAYDAFDVSERGQRMAKLRVALDDLVELHLDEIDAFMPETRDRTSPTTALYSFDFRPVLPPRSIRDVSAENRIRYQNVVGELDIIADRYVDTYVRTKPEGVIEISLDPSGVIVVGEVTESGDGLRPKFKEELVKLLRTL